MIKCTCYVEQDLQMEFRIQVFPAILHNLQSTLI